MKQALIVLAILASVPFQSFAAKSLNVLKCQGMTDQGPIDVRVSYEVKQGDFGDFLGYQAVLTQEKENMFFYCNGGCTFDYRKVVGGQVHLVVVDRTSGKPQLYKTLALSVPLTLTSPKNQDKSQVTVDVGTIGNADPAMNKQATGEIDCTAGEGAEFLLKAPR